MRIFLLLPIIAGLLFLCGCWDYNEMNMQEIVLTAAIDSGEKLELAVRCAPKGEEKEGTVYTSRGDSFYGAVRELSDRTDKKMYWGHTNTILFGEHTIASSLDTVFDTLFRAQDVYLDVVPIVARGVSGKEVISSGSDLLFSFANEENSRRRRSLQLWEIFRERDEFGAFVLPCIEKDDNGFKLSGGLAFSDDGQRYLDGEQMLLLELMTHPGAGGYLPPIQVDKKSEVTFEILGNDIKKEVREGKNIYTQKLVLSPGEINGEADIAKMQEAAEKYLTDRYAEFISMTEKNDMGNILKKKDSSLPLVMELSVKISDITGDK